MLSLYFRRAIKSAYQTMRLSRPMVMSSVLLAAAALARPQGGSTETASAAVARESSPMTVHSSEADDRLARAEKHFNAGRQFYFQDNLADARREFDAAIDALLNAPNRCRTMRVLS